MITKSIVHSVLNNCTAINLVRTIEAICDSLTEEYNADDLICNILEMCIDSKNIKTKSDVDIKYTTTHLDRFVYCYEKYNYKDVNVTCIDNFNCVVVIEYKYIEKINEERDDVSYNTGRVRVSWLDYPEILK